MSAIPQPRTTSEEYLAHEREVQGKHEYLKVDFDEQESPGSTETQ